jgi:hypothetical protein
MTDTTGRPARLALRTDGECDFDPQHPMTCSARSGTGSPPCSKFSVPATGLPAPSALTGPRVTPSPTVTPPRSLLPSAPMTARSTSLPASARESCLAGLAATADESPDATLRRLVATTEELLAPARDRLAQGHRFNVHLPYGRWTGWSSCCTASGIRGSTSVTCCSRGVWSTPLTATRPAMRPRTGCSSLPPWRRCSAPSCGRS